MANKDTPVRASKPAAQYPAMSPGSAKELVIVTGISGAGKARGKPLEPGQSGQRAIHALLVFLRRFRHECHNLVHHQRGHAERGARERQKKNQVLHLLSPV